MKFKFTFSFLISALIASLVPLSSKADIEHRAVAKRVAQDFKYQQSQLDNAVEKVSEMVDDMFRRLENIEDNQSEIQSCAKQDAPVDPDSYSIWDNGQGKCVTVTRDCVPAPTDPIESRELVFIFDASSSMENQYEPPTAPHNCMNYYDRYKEYCGGAYYPNFKQTHPVAKICGYYSTTKYCGWCGYEPSAPKEKVVIGTEIDGEGVEHDVLGEQYITEGKIYDDYIAELQKYEKCKQDLEASKCAEKYDECKVNASIEHADEIADYVDAYSIWKSEVYSPYEVCRRDQYSEYLTCVNEFNSIWNTSTPEPRIDAAKAAVKDAIKKAPTFVELGLVVFNGCENVKNHGFYLDADRTDLIKAVDAIDATGSTPLVDSMIIAAENMKIKSDDVNAEGYIVLVTDGEETCVSKDSKIAMKAVCDTAKALKKQNDGLVINVMDLSNNSKLSCISEYTGGVYASVSNEQTMLSSIVGEMSKISDIPEYCYAPKGLGEDYGTIDVHRPDPVVE